MDRVTQRRGDALYEWWLSTLAPIPADPDDPTAPAFRGPDFLEAVLLRVSGEKWRKMQAQRVADTGETGNPEWDAKLERIRAEAERRAVTRG